MVKFLATICLAGAAYSAQITSTEWKSYKAKFDKSYSDREDANRFAVYSAQMLKIKAHNERFEAGLESYRQGPTQFTDMETEEVNKKMNGYGKSSSKGPQILGDQYPCGSTFEPLPTMLPERNWVNEGAVTVVKNQMFCGDCWAFSAAACMEGQHFMSGGKLKSLSAQQITDCASSNSTLGVYDNDGCDGGWPQNAFYYAITNNGMEQWLDYPFSDVQETCQYQPSEAAATFFDCVDVTFGDEETLAYASSELGPISIAIDAALDSFHNYVDGIYYAPHCSSTQLDHAVTLVGYGTMPEQRSDVDITCSTDDYMCETIREGIRFEYPCMSAGSTSRKMTTYTPGVDCNPVDGLAGADFWMVKNSWGPTWGMKGYVLMARNMDNNCGIASAPTYINAYGI